MRITLLTTILCMSLPPVASASETTFVFRSMEDPAFPPDPAVCAAAPFRVNARLGASLWSIRTRADDGRVVASDEEGQRIGRATACIQLTNFAFPPWLQQSFYAQFELPEGTFTAVGTCTLISNAVPTRGLVLGGCALSLTSFPSAYLGGAVASLSVFNPFRLAGFNTGSDWTLQVYDGNTTDADLTDHSAHDQDLQMVEDTRSDEEIAAHRQP